MGGTGPPPREEAPGPTPRVSSAASIEPLQGFRPRRHHTRGRGAPPWRPTASLLVGASLALSLGVALAFVLPGPPSSSLSPWRLPQRHRHRQLQPGSGAPWGTRLCSSNSRSRLLAQRRTSSGQGEGENEEGLAPPPPPVAASTSRPPPPARGPPSSYNTNSGGGQGRRRPQRNGGGGGGGGKDGDRKWERSAPEEFLLILTNLRAQFGQLDAQDAAHTGADPAEVERDIGQVITLVRSLATRQWEAAAEGAAALCGSPLLDVVLSRMVLYAATQARDPDLALAVLAGMHERRIDVDAFMASLVAKAAAADRRWMPVVEVCKAQLSTNPVILGAARRAGGTGRRHEGFTQALASTIERGKFYSSSFLVDALLQFQMVDLFTAKVALKFYRFSRTPARALPWIATAKAIGLVPDADLDFEVGRVYKSLDMWREAVALLNEMVEKGRAVGDEHVGVVLSACHQAGEWQECMGVLERMRGWGLPMGRVSYLIVLRLLLERGRVDQARLVLRQMEAQGTPLDAETARLVLFTLAKRGPVHSSLEFLQLMRAHGVAPDLVAYTAVLRACARFREPDRALDVLAAMAAEGVAPDVLAVATVMEALTGAARWDEAFALFDRCRAEGLRPDIKGWTQVLHQATQAGRWDLFPRYLDEAMAEARAGTAQLDLRFFATVINACAEANRTDEALAVLASVRSYGLVPNVYCYSAAAKSCLARNRWRDALDLLAEARDLGIPTDATLYRTVLRCCWQARQWKSVLGLYGEMVARGLDVDARMYHQLMDAVSRAGQAELAAELLQEMAANGMAPLDGTLGAFLQCWYAKGEYAEAWRHLEGLSRWEEEEEDDDDGESEEPARRSRRALVPGPTAFADLMALCAKRGDWAEVLQLRERMRAYGLATTSLAAPHLVARAYAERGDWEAARWFVREEMGATTEYPEAAWRRTYGSLLALCSKRIEPAQALGLLREMEEARALPPDADAYHAAMDACAQAGMTQEVRGLFQAMRRRRDLVPRVESFTIMLELCAREGGKSGEALDLMDDLEALGLTPDMLCFNAAMEACRDAALDEAGLGPGAPTRVREHMKRWRDQEVMHTYNSEMAVLAARRAGAVGGSAGGVGPGVANAALRLLQEMQDNGIPRDTDSFNMALEACSRAGDGAAVRSVWAMLEAQGGPRASPDIFTYVTLANALVRDGQGDEAMRLLGRMVALGVAPEPGENMENDTKGSKGQAAGGKGKSRSSSGSSSSSSGGAGAGAGVLKKKTRWPAYYRDLWPQTAKTLGKSVLALAAEDGPGRCAEIGRLLRFLSTHLPILDAGELGEQLVGRGLCGTQHITTLTGASFRAGAPWREDSGLPPPGGPGPGDGRL